jgi:hypothetical protein
MGVSPRRRSVVARSLVLSSQLITRQELDAVPFDVVQILKGGRLMIVPVWPLRKSLTHIKKLVGVALAISALKVARTTYLQFATTKANVAAYGHKLVRHRFVTMALLNTIRNAAVASLMPRAPQDTLLGSFVVAKRYVARACLKRKEKGTRQQRSMVQRRNVQRRGRVQSV